MLLTPVAVTTADLPGDADYITRPTPGLGFEWSTIALSVAGVYLILVGLSQRWWIPKRWMRPAPEKPASLDAADRTVDTEALLEPEPAAGHVDSSQFQSGSAAESRAEGSSGTDAQEPEATQQPMVRRAPRTLKVHAEAVQSISKYQVYLMDAKLFDAFKSTESQLRHKADRSEHEEKVIAVATNIPPDARTEGADEWKRRCEEVVPRKKLQKLLDAWEDNQPGNLYSALRFVARTSDAPASHWIFNCETAGKKAIQYRVGA